MGISKSAHNNIFTHQNIISLMPLVQHLRTAQYSEFIIRVNSNDWDGRSTRIMLKNAQLRIGLQGCILTTDPALILEINLHNNFNFNLLKSFIDQMFSFRTIKQNFWNLRTQHRHTIISILQTPTDNDHMNVVSLEQARRKAIESFLKRPEKLLNISLIDHITHNNDAELLT
ncbi:unnamed protein product [Rhizophagus irregularis]|uniref:Uncharacterized protein n=1 Tax=Rhizophagus irregularis TaxID=588596 RepID=A0A2N1NP18_9GLOM|nr:hypothetical protein RhiirC2_773401 [Rhizophagus irregularis]CAB4376762.1 unnamed protein product [Rhizophagus irregularis]CAB5360225.1 unnamed protein product [Rhizophagus irregularis]